FSGANTATPIVRPMEIGRQEFTVEISNQFGCTFMDTTAVVVADTTDQTDFISAAQCSGLGVQFSTSGDNAPFYQWNFGDPFNFDPTATGTNPTYTYPSAGEYLVTVSLPDDLSCATAFEQMITVGEPQIEVDFTAEVSDCGERATVTFINTSVNQQSEIIAQRWHFPNRVTNEPTPTFNINNSQTIGATLIITSSDGCVDSLYKEFSFELLENTVSDTVAICNGKATPLNPDFNPNYQYQWSPATGLDDVNSANPLANPTETTTYQVTITDGNNLCELVTEVVAIVPTPVRFSTPRDTTICENSLELSVSGDGNYQYIWSTDGAFQNIIDSGATVTVNPLERQFYHVRATDEFGCEAYENFSVTNGTLDLLLPTEQTICINHPTQLPIINLNPNFPTTYQWSPIDSLDDSTILQPTVNPSESTTYTINAENSLGCRFTGSTRVNVFNFIPPLAISTDNERLETPDDIAQLSATIMQDYTYEWTPAIGLDNPNIPDPIAQPTETTTYTLTITNRDGCTNLRSLIIEVLNLECLPPNIFVPQAFSPNGDGKNDVLLVRGVPIESLYFAVYNRWGQLVFETEDQQRGWDGTVQGEAVPAAVFGYYLKVNCFGGEEFITKGNVTLIR
ncbi:MAG: gliding motility-associated C-terminal domain-containing protein, partial [Saprospiraceae bacterium]